MAFPTSGNAHLEAQTLQLQSSCEPCNISPSQATARSLVESVVLLLVDACTQLAYTPAPALAGMWTGLASSDLHGPPQISPLLLKLP